MPARWAAVLLAVVAALGAPGLARAQAQGCDVGDPNSLYDGYEWNGACVPGFVSVRTWFTPAPTHAIGAAVFYAPHVMEAQAGYRAIPLDGFLDGVALMSPADIGRTVWLRRPGFGWEGPFIVLDCASRDDFYPIIVQRGEVVEVGFRTALRWGMVRETATGWRAVDWRLDDVQVWKGDAPPAPGEAGEPTRQIDWMFDHLEFASGIANAFGEFTPIYRRDPPRWLWTDRITEIQPADDWLKFLWNEGNEETFCRGIRREVICRPAEDFDLGLGG